MRCRACAPGAALTVEQTPRRVRRHRAITDQFFADDHGVHGGLLAENVGRSDGDFGLRRVHVGGERAGADASQTRIGFGRHIGIVWGDEVRERVEADAHARLAGFLDAGAQAVPAVGKEARFQLEVPPRLERRAVVEIDETCPARHLDSAVNVRLAEVHDEIGAVGVGGDLGPDAIEHWMRKAFGDLDGANGFQRPRRRAGKQRDLAADDAAIVVGRREILLVAPVGDDPIAAAIAAICLQHAAKLRPPRCIPAEGLFFLQLSGQDWRRCRDHRPRIRRRCHPLWRGSRRASWRSALEFPQRNRRRAPRR